MIDTQMSYTALHGSCAEPKAVCEQCQAPFQPRITSGENRDRFCRPLCRWAWHNDRRREKENPPRIAAEAGEMAQQEQQMTAASFARKQTKIKRILVELARGVSLHRFQAEHLGDHCLHSTVAKIETYGIEVAREWVVVPGFAGHEARVCRYWLTPAERMKAAMLLGRA